MTSLTSRDASLGIFEVVRHLREVEILARHASVDVEHVLTRCLEVRRRVVRFGDEQLKTRQALTHVSTYLVSTNTVTFPEMHTSA